mmetsp:Transcript_16676/g.45806  ORF Transcript_16676/g.45806 Transcript_16676/m.45806 type:complete len:249 (-) Transcript_16676:320-1066(-)
MPKAKRNASLSRVARRRVATSENLPSPATRKKGDTGDGTTVAIESRPLGEEKTIVTNGKADAAQTEHQNKSKTTATATRRANDKDEPDVPQSQQLSRGQRKRQAKREQFLKKEKMILSSLMLQRQEDQKKRIDGLDAIKEALMDTATKNASGRAIEPQVLQHVTTNKAKRKLVAKEVEHMNLIMQHPSFKQDPFETMQQHLKNTFAEERKQQELLSKKRTEQEKLKSEAKKSIKKKSQKKKYKPRRTK